MQGRSWIQWATLVPWVLFVTPIPDAGALQPCYETHHEGERLQLRILEVVVDGEIQREQTMWLQDATLVHDTHSGVKLEIGDEAASSLSFEEVRP